MKSKNFQQWPINRERNCKRLTKTVRNKTKIFILDFFSWSVSREYYDIKISFSGGDVVSLLLGSFAKGTLCRRQRKIAHISP